jgi:hypothetical protein
MDPTIWVHVDFRPMIPETHRKANGGLRLYICLNHNGGMFYSLFPCRGSPKGWKTDIVLLEIALKRVRYHTYEKANAKWSNRVELMKKLLNRRRVGVERFFFSFFFILLIYFHRLLRLVFWGVKSNSK